MIKEDQEKTKRVKYKMSDEVASILKRDSTSLKEHINEVQHEFDGEELRSEFIINSLDRFVRRRILEKSMRNVKNLKLSADLNRVMVDELNG